MYGPRRRQRGHHRFIAVFSMRRTDGSAGRTKGHINMDGRRHEVRNPQLSATAQVFGGCRGIRRSFRRMPRHSPKFSADAEKFFLRNPKFLPFVSCELSHLPKLLDLKSGRARRISIGQTSKQIAPTFGDTNFGEKTNGLIIFT